MTEDMREENKISLGKVTAQKGRLGRNTANHKKKKASVSGIRTVTWDEPWGKVEFECLRESENIVGNLNYIQLFMQL